jgi:hypothetical protein
MEGVMSGSKKKEWMYKWTNLDCNRSMMMPVGRELKLFVLQSDALAYKCQMQKPRRLFQGRVLVKFSKAVFQAMDGLWEEAEKTNGGRWT